MSPSLVTVPTVTPPTHPDYAPQIRAEIECAVVDLKRSLRRKVCHPDELRVGHLTNCHRGLQVIPDGTEIAGLRVATDRVNPRTITVAGFLDDQPVGYYGYKAAAREQRSITW